MSTLDEKLNRIIANSKTGDQIPEALELLPENYLFVYVAGVGFRRVKKSNIVFGGEVPTKLSDLDTPGLLGQAGKILVVNETENGYKHVPLAEVSGVTQAEFEAEVTRLEGLIDSSSDSNIDHTYNTISLMIAGQNEQLEDDVIKVLDASEDPSIDSGRGYYFYNGTIAGTIDDYTSLTSTEVAALTSQAIIDALGYEPQPLIPYTPANDSEVVKSVTANGTTYNPDPLTGDVDLGTLATEGGGNSTPVVDTIWNTGDSVIFPVPDSSKINYLSVNGKGRRYLVEWERFSPTEIKYLLGLNDGDWVLIGGDANASAGATTPQDKTDVISYALSSPSADLVAGDTDSFNAPYDFTLNGYFIAVNEAPTGSSLVVDLKKNGASVTSTDAIIDATETTSLTGTAPVITEQSFLQGDKITPSIVQVGGLTTGKSLKIYLQITKQ